MSRKTDPAKQARKVAFRQQRALSIAKVRQEREEAFAAMFADLVEATPIENIEAFADLNEKES